MNKYVIFVLLVLASLSVCLSSCQKEEIHPRMQYIGDYYFELNQYFYTHAQGTTWNPVRTYKGYVAPDSVHTELLIIKCGDEEYGKLPLHFSTRYIDYGDENSNATFVWANRSSGMRGEFIGTDSLVIKYGESEGGVGSGWAIFGKKTE